MYRHDLQTHYEIHEIGSTAPVTVELLEKTWRTLSAEGKCFKILLITAPDNPTGCMYAESELKVLSEWCIEHKVHMIVNEIYGLSLIDTEDATHSMDYNHEGTYASFAKIMHTSKSAYLHLWYAFSKDFGVSGFRVGLVYSLNELFIP